MSTTPTRLWLATIYVHIPQDEEVEGVRTQRLVVVESDNEHLIVHRKVRQFAREWYGDRAKVEALAPVRSVAELSGMLDGVDLIGKSQFNKLDARHLPTSAVLEMGYDDYSPCTQETPSRIESLRYPNRELAEAASWHALQYVSEMYPDYGNHWTFRTELCELSSGEVDAVEAVESLIDEMMEHYLDDEPS